ncbi:MAG: hypothetical protein AAF251_05390 [Pseudomonadota bacterium]
MLLTSLAFSLGVVGLPVTLQGAQQTAVAVINENPETWTVEYPRIIRPFVVRYRQCLNISNRRVTGRPDFEDQHRTDVPRCVEQREKAMEGARTEMVSAKTRLSATELHAVFETVAQIHIARGRDLDDQFKQRVAAAKAVHSQYQKDKPKGLVLELVDGSVVKSRAELDGKAEPAGESKAIN